MLALVPKEEPSPGLDAGPNPGPDAVLEPGPEPDVDLLPECKIKRNYLCMMCSYFTQNPRFYLHHLRDVHNEKMRIYECNHCLYASKHSQKLHRHVAMVHAPNKPPRRRSGSWVNIRSVSTAATVVESSPDSAPAPAVDLAPGPVPQPLPTFTLKSSPGPGPGPSFVFGPNAAVTLTLAPRPCVVKSEPEDADSEFLDDDSNDRLVIEYPEEEDESQAGGGGEQAEETAREGCGEGVTVGEGEAAEEARGGNGGRAAPADEDVQEHEHEEQAVDSRLEMDPVTRQYKCSSCPFQSKTPSLVARHESVVHLKRKFYRCNKCTYVTHLKARFTKHYKYHTMPLIKCGECDFRTPYKWNLDRHLKNHNGIGSFKCSVCSFAADIKQSLTVHEMNHHTPPVGNTSERPPGNRRRCKVGGSDCRNVTEEDHIEERERELLRLEREDSTNDELEGLLNGGGSGTVRSKPPSPIQQALTGEVPIVSSPEKSTRCTKSLRCAQCDYCSASTADMSRHILMKHGAAKSRGADPGSDAPSAKRAAKPLPNLIPIQAQSQTAPRQSLLKTVAEKPSSPTPSTSVVPSPDVDDTGDDSTREGFQGELTVLDCENETESTDQKTNFFDQLKLFPGSSTDPNLICMWCGHEAKCTSELVRHNKLHSGQSRGVTASSTRCQHCRQRCKTHSELLAHLKTCSKAEEALALSGKIADTAGDPSNSPDSGAKACIPLSLFKTTTIELSAHSTKNGESTLDNAAEDEKSRDSDFCRVSAGEPGEDGPEEEASDACDLAFPVPTDDGLVAVEVAPGFGAVRAQTESEAEDPFSSPYISLKKVFKCPHCSFWASTASRFHVHIVGHLNKKPFECSLCNYRSNWRWDITKHIRLKLPRDPSHEGAKVLMIDETGRRNYSKYNKHLMVLKVESDPECRIPAVGRQSKAVATGMQGNVAGPVDPVPILPAPPKLTRAPTPRANAPTPPALSGAILRPPPPLQAGTTTHLIILPAGVRLQQPQVQIQQGQVAQQVQSPSQTQPLEESQASSANKRPADDPLPSLGSEPKKANSENKKTVWRCKQCHFRDGDRAIVLAHVKGHYRQQQEAALAKLNSSGSQSTPSLDKPMDTSTPMKATLQCNTCPYSTVSEVLLETHKKCHKQTSDAIFKCHLCPYYVNSKDELLQHSQVHKGEDIKPKEPECQITSVSVNHQPTSGSSKPAVKEVDSKSPEKKEKVSSRASVGADEMARETQSTPQPLPSYIDVKGFHDAPLCWVFRHEKLVKMYRCRHCPHVNSRKSNIAEHERMHGKRSASGSEPGEPVVPSQYMPYPCPDCNYVCNNAGVLSSHMKVHLSNYPQAYSIVDPSKSENRQMNEIIEKYDLTVSLSPEVKGKPPVAQATPPTPPEVGHENKLKNVDLMSLLNPNQSLTDAILAMKKKFNLELDGEPFAEPHEDFLESSPTSPLKQLNEDLDTIIPEDLDDKKMYFCRQCPARFLFRKELGIHSRFHNLHLVYRCENCSYTARQRTHLQAHSKIHSNEYQERTTVLLKMYQVHKDFPMPRTAAIAQKPGTSGAIWVVVNAVTKPIPVSKDSLVPQVEKPKFFCSKCPASFFKTLALNYHMTLHGGDGAHKCRLCDYAVKTYGNLVKHMSLHGVEMSPKKVRKVQKKEKCPPPSVEDNKKLEEANGTLKIKEEEVTPEDKDPPNPSEPDDVKENDPVSAPLKNHDEQFGVLINGSPNFVYPTYFRNGRMKEKRYKCHKCPSAFEKREQYNIHQALHGSNQRYKCNKCDYSVKYYANYVQHFRRHKSSEEAKAATSPDETTSSSNEVEDLTTEDSENVPNVPSSSPSRSGKTTGGKVEKLSVADKQAMMIMQARRAKRSFASHEILDKNYWCSHCPYSSPRRDLVESHMKRHIAESGSRNAFVCEHCDYTVPNKHFLRDHYKLHFDVSKAPRPDAFMICEKLELWASDSCNKNHSKGKILIFQDRACTDKPDRFVPPLLDEDDAEDDVSLENKVFINLKTLEPEMRSSSDEKETNENEETNGGRSDSIPDEEMKEDFIQGVTVNELSGTEALDVSTSSSTTCLKHESDDRNDSSSAHVMDVE